MAHDCFICGDETSEEETLNCSTCHKSYHFRCGTGLSDVAQRTITTYLMIVPYKCPICTIGENNKLLHIVLTKNQVYNETKHATDFDPGNAIHQADTADTAGTPPANNPATVAGDTTNPHVETDVAEHRVEPPPLPPSLAGESLTPLHEHDISRSKKLSYLLSRLIRLPGHPNTGVFGDSHLSHLDGKEIDPDDDQVRVRSVGGLCIPATVYALAHHKTVHKHFKKVCWVLGTNDALHGSEQHCPDDREKYIRLLHSESARVFPNATIYFILPFVGMTGVSKPFIDGLERVIKTAAPDMVVARPPKMTDKISKKGVHLSKTGRSSFIGFLRTRFVAKKHRVFSRDSGRARLLSQGGPVQYTAALQSSVVGTPQAPQHVHTAERVNNLDPFKVGRVNNLDPSTLGPSYPGLLSLHGAPKVHDQGLVQDIVAKVMDLFAQQNVVNRYYPPLQPWPTPAPHR